MIWLLLFFLAPLLIIVKMSFSEGRDSGIPPYEPVFGVVDGIPTFNATLNSFKMLFQDGLYVSDYFQSLQIAGISTLICLLIGYPMALAIARSPARWRVPLLLLVILPFWTSFLVRIYALMGLLREEGLLNSFLVSIGVISKPLIILNTDIAIYIGIVYSYLPFMVLPLYATLEKLDPSLLEAAADLGARPLRAFLSVTLPLSLPGIAAGGLLVFVPAVGEYVIPSLMGGGETTMLGKSLWDMFALNRDWPGAAALAVGMLAGLAIPIALFQRWQANLEKTEDKP